MRLRKARGEAPHRRGGDAFFLFTHPVALLFMVLSVGVIVISQRKRAVKS